MYDRVLVITINSYYSKVPITGTAVQFYQGTEYRYRGTFKKYRAHLCIFIINPNSATWLGRQN